MRRQLYTDIKNRLKRLIIDENGNVVLVTEEQMNQLNETGITPRMAIRHFGLWNRQVEFIEQEDPFPLPAVFIEFGKIEWRHQSGGVQDASLTVGLHVLSESIPEGYDGSEFHLDLLDKINQCLHGFDGEYFSSMKRSASIPCHDHEQILDDTEIFQTQIYDRSSVKTTTKLSPSPDFSMPKG